MRYGSVTDYHGVTWNQWEKQSAEESWVGVWAWLGMEQLLSTVGIQQRVQPEQLDK